MPLQMLEKIAALVLGAVGASGRSRYSAFYNTGAVNISVTGAQSGQHSLYCFDATALAHILALASANAMSTASAVKMLATP
jgi:hypothetical protein